VSRSRSTPEDEEFKRRVAEEFTRARERAERKGFSFEDFLRKLGVTRAAFHKYVNRKAIPSLRVLLRAQRFWEVRLSYGDLGVDYVSTKKKDPRQMEFQFSVADISKEQIEIKKISAKGESAVEFLIRIDFSKSA
jgi:transcriptional regulator with XRE-family HTH domain